MATYIALTATNPPSDWHVVPDTDALGRGRLLVGSDSDQLMRYAEYTLHHGHPERRVNDIYLDTELVNLRVVSKTKALRVYGIRIEQELDAWRDFQVALDIEFGA